MDDQQFDTQQSTLHKHGLIAASLFCARLHTHTHTHACTMQHLKNPVNRINPSYHEVKKQTPK